MGRSMICGTLLAMLLGSGASALAAAEPDPAGPAALDQRLTGLEWRLIGPFRGGRVTAVAGHPDRPHMFYQGATGGGVWKTEDAGQSWQNISDGHFRTTTIGAIAVAPSNPDILYVGTGEAPVRGVATSHGDGVYRSDDGGRSWRHLGLAATRQISRIQIDPRNPERAWVAAQGNPWGPNPERGIYRTEDGGKSWSRVLFVDAQTGASDISMAPGQPDLLFAAMWDHQRLPWTVRSGGPGSGIWRSADGGRTWSRLTNGLPSLMGRIGVAVSPADPQRVWAMVEAGRGGVYRSDDGGGSWRRVNADPGIRDRGWYYSHVFAHPTDREQLFVLAAPMVRSRDGGATFEEVRTPHGDNHDLWINPRNPELMVQGNDGGANVSLNGGRTWSTQMNQPTGQFYRIDLDDSFPYRIYSAQQDNTSVRIPSRTLSGSIGVQDWQPVGGGESSFFGVDPERPDRVYAGGLLGGLTEYDGRTGTIRDVDPYPTFAGFQEPSKLAARFNWNAPVLVSRHRPGTIYHGGNRLFRSVDRGLNWQAISPDLTRARPETLGTTGGPIMIEGAGGEHYATLTYVAESPHDAQTIWTGSDDGLVHVTRDGGGRWANVTPPGLPEGQINAIDVSPHDPDTAYLAVARYKLNDFAPYALKTSDGGRSWSRITRGLPADSFVRVIRADPVRKGLLYAGTEAGLYVSFDDGAGWQPLRLNLPTVPITDLKVKGDDLVAATQGRAIWVLDDLGPLREWTPELAARPAHLFQPAPAIRLEGGGRGGPGGGENPPDGAVFHYHLAQPPAAAVSLEIVDAAGTVIRRFSSTASERAETLLVKGAQGEPPAPPLPTAPGLNRYVWNLRVAPAERVGDIIRFVRNRPYRVAPGRYLARLRIGDQVLERPFEVQAHPGLDPVTDAAWQDQQAVLARLHAMVSDVHRETNRLRALARQLRSRPDAAGRGALLRDIAAWEEQVPQAPLPGGAQDRIGYPSRLLSTQILHLMAMVDQPPPITAAARARADELGAQWARLAAAAAAIRARGARDFGIDVSDDAAARFDGNIRGEEEDGDALD